MAWVEILPRFVMRFRRQGLDSAAAFLAWTGILVNRHRRRQVEEVSLPATGEAEHGFYLKKESAVSWRDRLRNAWHGFGWCATSVRERALLQALRQAGIGCPEVAAFGEDGRRAFMLTCAEPGMTDLRVLLPTLDEPERERLADALGDELARLHDAGFDHPDLFAKHILAGADGATYRFCILDWQRGRRRHVVSWRLRCRDLAVLDATLHPSLADNRLRMRLLRAYRRASPGLAPLASMARDIRTAAMRLRARRHIREIGQLPVAACDHQFVPASEGRLLVVRSYYESNGGRLPEWLTRMAEPDAPAKELADALASASGSGFMLHTWPNDGLEWELPALAHTLFRLQRFGVPAPRLLAVGQSSRSVFLLATSVLAAPFRETFAKAPAPLQTQMLQRAGAIVRQIHAAGYALPAGESWDCRLGVVPATGAIVLVKAEPLLRDHAPGREPSQLAFDPKRMLLSPAEQLRFLQGYFEDERKVEARIRELSAVPASVEEAAR